MLSGCLAFPAVADEFFANSYAIVVGIDNYPSPHWPKLNYAVADARAIARYLGAQGYEVITLYEQQATKQAILAAMQNTLAPRLKTSDRVLVFFAGHGETETLGGKDRGYIVPYDGAKQSAGFISMEDLFAESSYMGDARHQLFIIDSCYGGLLANTRASVVDPGVPDYLSQITKRFARQAITAGGKDQQVLDTGPGGHSYFVDFLLEALRDGLADTNGDGYITFNELTAYLIPRASNNQQTPSAGILPGHGAGEYLFKVPGARAAVQHTRVEPPPGARRGANSPPVQDRAERTEPVNAAPSNASRPAQTSPKAGESEADRILRSIGREPASAQAANAVEINSESGKATPLHTQREDLASIQRRYNASARDIIDSMGDSPTQTANYGWIEKMRSYTSDDTPARFQREVVGTTSPLLWGLVFDPAQAGHTQISLSVSTPPYAELILNLDGHLASSLTKGTMVGFRGQPVALSRNPFRLTFKVSMSDLRIMP
jgi:uncharacterized caspase-like protein